MPMLLHPPANDLSRTRSSHGDQAWLACNDTNNVRDESRPRGWCVGDHGRESGGVLDFSIAVVFSYCALSKAPLYRFSSQCFIDEPELAVSLLGNVSVCHSVLNIGASRTAGVFDPAAADYRY